ncbi:DUF1998 domain-containing protein [Thalassomonas actiniarum]|uniref:DUF1998 domain-containing protein n=1 Tax=Thalassomonas actiniarum TaxID=485447 RepID=A0AAE9YWA0_9GAMM|nr:DUF1998 domain-containing protein [Thalassomonas actiniarum]WDE00737.1 DUF1998 domain-containing protein [Thalassomonas actiniarum]
MAVDRTVRRSQTITPFGVGGIYDFGSESFVAMDTIKWDVHGDPDIHLPRLERVLRVQGFRGAPVAGRALFPGAYRSGKPVPYLRFPTWLFCPTCRGMVQWSPTREKKGEHPYCLPCGKKSQLVPMRFMAVCKKGHLTDVPWGVWAHIGSKGGCQNHKLQFKSSPEKGAGLQSLSIYCLNCKAENNLERLPFKDSLDGLMKRHQGTKGCKGTHPWQKEDLADFCDQAPQVVQRGASNAYYPVVESAIDIRVGEKDEDSIFELIRVHPKWEPLKSIKGLAKSYDDPYAKIFIQPIVDDEKLQKLGVTSQIVWECLQENEKSSEEVDEVLDDEDLLLDEWLAFITPPKSLPGAEFIADKVDLASFSLNLQDNELIAWEEFRRLISQVTLAKKLRIVRALKGFTRLEPNYENIVSPSLGANVNWLPATEIYGEGIFIALDKVALDDWEKKLPAHVLADIRDKLKKSSMGFLPEATDRFVLLHTLAHLLIRQLCFECGYSSSSLSERIYSDKEKGMSGILIYTASADSEGALGGLVREGLPDRLYGTFKTALFRANWCSSDPICSELKHQGIQGLNKAACHACTLVAETSCNYANSLLDRTVLIGREGEPTTGYFNRFISLIEDTV